MSLKYILRFFLKWLRFTIMAFLKSNIHTKKAILRIFLGRIRRFIPRVLGEIKNRQRYPTTVQIIDSVKCRGRCKDCLYLSYEKQDNRLSLSTLERILKQSYELHISTVYLVGADPFYREDIHQLIRLLEKQKTQFFLLFTDGLHVGEEVVDRIVQAGNIFLVFNIDGRKEATEARKGPGSFEKLSRTMQSLKKRKALFAVSTMINQRNFREVIGMEYLFFLKEKGADFLAYIPFVSVQDNESKEMIPCETYKTIFPTTLEQNRRIKDFIVLDLLGIEENLTSCPGGDTIISVYHDGTVTPCFAFPAGIKESNINKKSLKEIFFTDPFFQLIRKRKGQLKRNRALLKCLFFHPRWLHTYLSAAKDSFTILSEGLYNRIMKHTDIS